MAIENGCVEKKKKKEKKEQDNNSRIEGEIPDIHTDKAYNNTGLNAGTVFTIAIKCRITIF